MEPNTIWKAVLVELELSVSKATYQTQFAHTTLLFLVDGVATIAFTTPLMRTMAEGRYYSLVKSILDHHTKLNTSLIFTVAPRHETLDPAKSGPLFSQTEFTQPEVSVASVARRLHIRPESTFIILHRTECHRG